MDRNIEIKARVPDLRALLDKVSQLSEPEARLSQKDTFFFCNTGRLKIREFQDKTAELIFYQRADNNDASLSSYIRTPVAEPNTLASILAKTLGKRGTVKKQRLLFMVGQTRIHVDQVENLGDFVELEVVLSQNQTTKQGTNIAKSLMEKLGVLENHLESGAYIDLLEAKA